MPRQPETKIVRTGRVISGEYRENIQEVAITVEVDGARFVVMVHPETAARFHCGTAFSMTLTVT